MRPQISDEVTTAVAASFFPISTPSKTNVAAEPDINSAPPLSLPPSCRQDRDKNSSVSNGIDRCKVYFTALNGKMCRDWGYLVGRCEVLRALLDGPSSRDHLHEMAARSTVGMQDVRAARAAARNTNGPVSRKMLWQKDDVDERHSPLLARLMLGPKGGTLGPGLDSATAALRVEIREVERFLLRFCSMHANRLLDWRSMFLDTGALNKYHGIERKIAAVYGAFREFVSMSFEREMRPSKAALAGKRDVFHDACSSLETLLDVINEREKAQYGGGFMNRVKSIGKAIGDFGLGVLKSAVQVVAMVAMLPIGLGVLVVAAPAGVLSILKTTNFVEAFSQNIRTAIFVNARMAWMLLTTSVYEWHYGNASLSDMKPMFKGCWDVITKYGIDGNVSGDQDRDIQPMYDALGYINSLSDGIRKAVWPHITGWEGSPMRAAYDEIFAVVIDDLRNDGTREKAASYIVDRCTGAYNGTYVAYQQQLHAGGGVFDGARIVGDDTAENEAKLELVERLRANESRLNDLGEKVLMRLRMSTGAASKFIIFRLMCATLKVLLIASYKSSTYALWLNACFKTDGKIVYPSTQLEMLYKMMVYLRDNPSYTRLDANGIVRSQSYGGSSDNGDGTCALSAANVNVGSVFKELMGDHVVCEMYTMYHNMVRPNTIGGRGRYNNAKWTSTGRTVTLKDGAKRTLYKNAARPGELRVKRMVVPAGTSNAVATYVKPPAESRVRRVMKKRLG